MIKGKLSIIIPCYNEKKTIRKIVNKILLQRYIKKQIIIIDDCSTDGSREEIRLIRKKIDHIIYHDKNYGKGACIISAKKFIKGNVVIIQDADLEYNPDDYEALIMPVLSKEKKVIYGSRVLGRTKNELKSIFFEPNIRILGNYILTKISNILNSQKLTDAHTCYKVFDAKLFKKLKFKQHDFTFCPEITSLVSRLGIQIKELPISYLGRNYNQGKKIKFLDAIKAFYVLLKIKFSLQT